MEIEDASFTVRWTVEGAVDGYYVYVADSEGNAVVAAEDIDATSFKVDAARMRPNEPYTLRVGARPEGGDADDIVWQTATFIKPETPAEQPAPELITPTPAPLPGVGHVETPEIDVQGAENEDGVIEVEGSSFRIRWHAEGDVQSYNVQITDGNGELIANQAGIAQTELTVKASQMQPGMVYTIAVGAIPTNGSGDDVAWSRTRFALPAPAATPAPATPVPTDAPTPVPTPAEVGRPTVTVGGSGYQQDGVQYMTDSKIILSWGAEGSVDSYIVYVENQDGERQNLGATTDTSRTVSTANLPSGIYTVYVGAIPSFGTQEDAQWGVARFGIGSPEPEAPEDKPVVEAPEEPEEPDEAPVEDDAPQEDGGDDNVTPIRADADPGAIQRLQMQLYRLGVMAGEPEEGVLDEVTLEAVAEFQSRANEQYDAGLPVLDPYDPDAVVDVETLSWIARGL